MENRKNPNLGIWEGRMWSGTEPDQATISIMLQYLIQKQIYIIDGEWVVENDKKIISDN